MSTAPAAPAAALRACWHPVAYATQVGRAPHVAYRRAMRAHGFA